MPTNSRDNYQVVQFEKILYYLEINIYELIPTCEMIFIVDNK